MSGKTTERLGVHKVTTSCFMLTVILLVLFAFTRNIYVACVFVALLSITTDLFYPSQVALGMSYVPRHLGTASGISYGLVVSVGGIFEPLLGAVGDHYGLPEVMIVMAFVAFIGTVCALIIRRADSKLKQSGAPAVHSHASN